MPPAVRGAAASIAALALISACAAGSGAGTPHIKPERLVRVSLKSVEPRVLDVSITDERQPAPETSAAMLVEVRTAVDTILTRAGISVVEGARNRLVLAITYPDSGWKGLAREDCIVMKGTITLVDGSDGTSSAHACFAYKNLYGLRTASDATGVYEQVINGTFDSLDDLPSATSAESRSATR
jgi:hypothetical protein